MGFVNILHRQSRYRVLCMLNRRATQTCRLLKTVKFNSKLKKFYEPTESCYFWLFYNTRLGRKIAFLMDGGGILIKNWKKKLTYVSWCLIFKAIIHFSWGGVFSKKTLFYRRGRTGDTLTIEKWKSASCIKLFKLASLKQTKKKKYIT